MSVSAEIEGVFQMLILDAYSRGEKIVLPSIIQKMVIFHHAKPSPGKYLNLLFILIF